MTGSPTPAVHDDTSEVAAWLRRLSEAFVSEGKFAVGFKAAADGLDELGRLRAIVTQLADTDPHDDRSGFCHFGCDSSGEHESDCPWRLAREAIYTNPEMTGENE